MAASGYVAGDLRSRITLEVATKTPDGSGGNVAAWAAFAVRWAAIMPLGGTELFRAQQVDPELSHKVVIRYLAGVVAAMRARSGVRIFDIRAVVDVDERHEWLELTCAEYKP